MKENYFIYLTVIMQFKGHFYMGLRKQKGESSTTAINKTSFRWNSIWSLSCQPKVKTISLETGK